MHRGFTTTRQLNRFDTHLRGVFQNLHNLLIGNHAIRIVVDAAVFTRDTKQFVAQIATHAIRAEATILITEIADDQLDLSGGGDFTACDGIQTVAMPVDFQRRIWVHHQSPFVLLRLLNRAEFP